MLVDPRRNQPVGRLGRQQQVVDADAPVLLPGARLVIPERVEALVVADRANCVGQAKARQRASGLMWLTVACDGPGAKEPWITELREASVKQASDDERALALILLKRWVGGRGD